MGWLCSMVRRLSMLLNPPHNPREEGRCGAVALEVAYHTLGVRASIPEIWTKIRTEDEWGWLHSSGYRMCRDALDRGLHAVLLEVRYERRMSLLSHPDSGDIAIVLNHVSGMNFESAHFSILGNIGREYAEVIDPSEATVTRFSKDELLEWWAQSNPIGGGNMLLAISKGAGDTAECASCGLGIPEETVCPSHECGRMVPIEPRWILGCISRECPEANWERLICPYCGSSIEDLRSWSPW